MLEYAGKTKQVRFPDLTPGKQATGSTWKVHSLARIHAHGSFCTAVFLVCTGVEGAARIFCCLTMKNALRLQNQFLEVLSHR